LITNWPSGLEMPDASEPSASSAISVVSASGCTLPVAKNGGGSTHW
jgi:hypothetical protein